MSGFVCQNAGKIPPRHTGTTTTTTTLGMAPAEVPEDLEDGETGDSEILQRPHLSVLNYSETTTSLECFCVGISRRPPTNPSHGDGTAVNKDNCTYVTRETQRRYLHLLLYSRSAKGRRSVVFGE